MDIIKARIESLRNANVSYCIRHLEYEEEHLGGGRENQRRREEINKDIAELEEQEKLIPLEIKILQEIVDKNNLSESLNEFKEKKDNCNIELKNSKDASSIIKVKAKVEMIDEVISLVESQLKKNQRR